MMKQRQSHIAIKAHHYRLPTNRPYFRDLAPSLTPYIVQENHGRFTSLIKVFDLDT